MGEIIGIIGGGQLGRMLTIAAKKMGFRVIILDPTPGSPAGLVADEQIVADFADEMAIQNLAGRCIYLTYEIELAHAQTLANLVKEGVIVHPSPETLGIIQDKWSQKEFLAGHKIPTANSMQVERDEEAIFAAMEEFGVPFVLKQRRGGYDGRGNAVIKSPNDIAEALQKLSGDLYVEEFVSFERELAVIAARSTQGSIVVYPVVETIQQNNICHMVIAPAQVGKHVAEQATRLARNTMECLKGAGVFGLEMFEINDQVLINEIAPRVHNSGHFTIEACRTSQFEQHIRAITGVSLGDTTMIVPAAVMINILGDRTGVAQPKGISDALRYVEVSVHMYGKHETRPERKMGHITAVGETLEATRELAVNARNKITI
jgi:5-(carboxyamino)imidazole ribonucleotide synthase